MRIISRKRDWEDELSIIKFQVDGLVYVWAALYQDHMSSSKTRGYNSLLRGSIQAALRWICLSTHMPRLVVPSDCQEEGLLHFQRGVCIWFVVYVSGESCRRLEEKEHTEHSFEDTHAMSEYKMNHLPLHGSAEGLRREGNHDTEDPTWVFADCELLILQLWKRRSLWTFAPGVLVQSEQGDYDGSRQCLHWYHWEFDGGLSFIINYNSVSN